MADKEQITLNVDLYDNIMTEKEGDYTGRPRITGTLHNKEMAARVVSRIIGISREMVEQILDIADQCKAEAVAEGKSVVDGMGQYLPTIRGNFIGADAQFDPTKHTIGISYTIGTLLRNELKQVNVACHGIAQTGPVINFITDSTTGSVSEIITPSGPAVISGSNLKIMGDDPSVGVFLTLDEESAPPIKCPLVIRNTPSELTVMLPAFETKKKYTLSVTTQYGPSNKPVKAPRTYRFPILLSDGKGGVERPGIL